MMTSVLTCLLAALLSTGCQKDKNFNVHSVSSPAEIAAIDLKPGDVVEWKDGTYDNVKFTLKAVGTQDKPIVLRAHNYGKVHFTGASGITLDGCYLVCEGFSFKKPDTSVKYGVLNCARKSHHCRFSDISIDGSESAVSDVDTKWVNLYGEHNEVSHCTFTDKRNMGCLFVVWLETGIIPEHVIAFNRFTRPYTHYNYKGHARNGQEALRIGTSDYSMQDARCSVYGNYFHDCDGELAEVISNKSCGNTYTGNVFDDCRGTLTLRHGNRCTVRGNYFRSTGKGGVGGVRIIGEDHVVEDNFMLNLTGNGYKSGLCIVMGESNAALNGYWTVINPIIRNNVLVNCSMAISINVKGRQSQDTAPRNVRFTGNTVVCSSGDQCSVNMANPTPEQELHWDGNILYGGYQEGISVPETKSRPSVKDCSKEIKKVISKSGIQW